MKNQWFMANMPTNFGTETTICEQAAAFYEERAKGGVGAVVVGIEDIKNFDLKSMQNLGEKLHTYDCQLWIACELDTTTIDFVKDCGADGIQLDMEKTDITVLEMLKNKIHMPILLRTEKCMDKTVCQAIEDLVYGVVVKGSVEDCEKVKKEIHLPVVWECDVITKQEVMYALEKKQCDAIASQKMFLAAPDFVKRWEQEQPYCVCCQCGVCIEAMENKKPICCPYCPETGREYLENQRRKIATRKEVIVTGCNAVGLYAAKKAAERGFLTTVLCEKNKKSQRSMYETYLMATLEQLGVKIETEQSPDTKYLMEKKPYLTVFVYNHKHCVPDLPNLQNIEYILAEDVLQYNKKDMKQFKNCNILLLGGNQQAVDVAIYLRQYTNGKIYMVEQKLLEKTDIKNENILEDLDKQNIQIVYGAAIQEVQQDGVSLKIGEQRFNWSFRNIQNASENQVKIVVSTDKEYVDNRDVIMTLMDERLSYAVIGENDEITTGLEEAFELFSRFYLA